MRKLLWLVPAALLAVGGIGYAADKEPSAKAVRRQLRQAREDPRQGARRRRHQEGEGVARRDAQEGPDGKDMDKKTINLGCGMVLKDKKSLEGYKKKADEEAAK